MVCHKLTVRLRHLPADDGLDEFTPRGGRFLAHHPWMPYQAVNLACATRADARVEAAGQRLSGPREPAERLRDLRGEGSVRAQHDRGAGAAP